MVRGHHDRDEDWANRLWEAYLTGHHHDLGRKVRVTQAVFGRLPATHRCRVCLAPFDGLSGKLAGFLGFGAGASGFEPNPV